VWVWGVCGGGQRGGYWYRPTADSNCHLGGCGLKISLECVCVFVRAWNKKVVTETG